MFKFLKEALSDTPTVNPSTPQRLAAQGFPVRGPEPRRASVVRPGTAAAGVAKEIPVVKKLEDDATEEDLVVKTLLEELQRMNKGAVEVVKLGEVRLFTLEGLVDD
jgi:hypothetical protein